MTYQPYEPNYDQQMNATLYQVFASGMVVQTPCYINIVAVPPLASGLTPVEAEAFQGKETDRYILFNNVQYRNYVTQPSTDTVAE